MAVDEEEDAVYCICRSSDISRFMIGCDKCDEWYHGDCISVSAEDASVIKKYYCNRCRNNNPGLKIKYKRKYREQFQLTKPEKVPTSVSPIKPAAAPVQKVSEKHSSNEVKRTQDLKSEKSSLKSDSSVKHESKDSSKTTDKVPKTSASESSMGFKQCDSQKERDNSKKILPKTQTSLSIAKDTKERKLKPEDAILKDKAIKLGKSEAERNLEKLLEGENIKTANKMKDDNKSKSSATESKLVSPPLIKSERDNKIVASTSDILKVSTPQKDKMCVSKTEISPTGLKVVTIETKPCVNSSLLPLDNVKQPGCRPSITIMMDDVMDCEEPGADVFGGTVLSTNTEDNAINDTEGYYQRRKKKRKYMDAMTDGLEGGNSGSQWTRSSTHCFGPGCQKISRRNSKYCSDECGMALGIMLSKILTAVPLSGLSLN